jgi:hypothetical protein
MKIPDRIYTQLKETLWARAEALNWPTLSDQQKSALYEDWLREPGVGGLLSRYLDPANTRVYVKDTIMKPYGRERIKDFSTIQKLLSLPENLTVVETYIKPHGRRLNDGAVVCWGLSRDWKAILFAVFERAYLAPSGVPFAAIIMSPTGKSQQIVYKQMIETAAARMGIEHLIWYDM